MNCPVCNRTNAVTISICPRCGAMVDDSVREELVCKIFNGAKRPNDKTEANKMTEKKPSETTSMPMPMLKPPATAPRLATEKIAIKPTSPTLVEFHNRNAAIPEWRLQLQNVVRQRQGRAATNTRTEIAPTGRAELLTSGANALKAETLPAPQISLRQKDTLTSALERIEQSRRRFLVEEKPPSPLAVSSAPVAASKNYPFRIAPKTVDTAAAKPAEINAPVNAFARPQLAAAPKPEREKLDTNKLPPLPVQAMTAFESQPIIVVEETEKPVEKTVQRKIEVVETPRSKSELTETTEAVETVETAETAEIVEEYEDCAPLTMRFNAGLFDLIIGSFVSLLLLAPFMLYGGNWFSVAGAFAFLTTCAIVMFIYLTTSIGLLGRTFGMRLFSLEVIDVETDEYPTFHQSAVSSAVYLLSLAFGGIGFLSLPFTEDRRAVHDIVSGTIIVREP